MAQPMIGAPVALPANVAEVAHARQLGRYLGVHQPKRLGGFRLFCVALLVVVPAVMVVVFAIALVWPGVFVGLAIGAPFVWMGLRTPNFSATQAAKRLHIFEHGFIVAQAAGPVYDCRWDAVAWVKQQITARYYNGIHVGTFHVYTVSRKDGAQLKLTDFYDGIGQFGQRLTKEVANAQLPGAIAAIGQGQTLPFGAFSVSGAGVSSGSGLLPWAELDRVDLAAGYVQVRKTGKRLPWARKAAGQIPNLLLFLHLAENRLQGVARPN